MDPRSWRMGAGRTRRPSGNDGIPDVRDGLNRVERTVLWILSETQKERRGRSVPTAMLYGRVLEHVDITETELIETLQRLGASS